jgi:UDP-N-acetyl-D-mannosaminuronic acid dehydrogenase
MSSRGRADVTIVGLGYVGLVLAVVLARSGLRVVGIETNADVRADVRSRRSPFAEPNLAQALRAIPEDMLTVEERLRGTAAASVVICVGTAVDPVSRKPRIADLVDAVDAISDHLEPDTLVVVRSTVPVGTCRRVVLPRLRREPRAPLLAHCPERTIQGRALEELVSLPQIIGGLDRPSEARARDLFSNVASDHVTVSSLEAAEMIKLICNAHTDLIYGFGNEVAIMAEVLGLDADELIAAANQRYPRPDLSRPGFVGGSCLTKDPYLLLHAAEEAGYTPPLVASARRVNESVPSRTVERLVAALEATGRSLDTARILVCGMAYKGRPATDDVRGAASATVASLLAGRVALLAGHDFEVSSARTASLGFEPVGLAEGLEGADALLLLVDHPAYADLDAETLCRRMRVPAVVIDVWGLLKDRLEDAEGITYHRLGRGRLADRPSRPGRGGSA